MTHLQRKALRANELLSAALQECLAARDR